MTDHPDDMFSLDDLIRGIVEPRPKEKGKKTPFKFLDPYGPEDKDIFFGRETEVAEIYYKFYKDRLLLVYGESGAGKTSLTQCGLRSSVPPEDALFLSIRSAIDPLESLKKEILRQVSFTDRPIPENYLDLLREAAFIKSKTIVLLFDQFEEFFILPPQFVRERFIQELVGWLDADINIRVVILIREEYLARMTELESFFPQIYQNKLWVRRMSRSQAQEAIMGPCSRLGIGVEPKLAQELLDALTKGGKGVELPILQVALDTLYNQAIEVSADSPVLTLKSYLELGRIESILGRFVEDKVNAHDNTDQLKQVLKTMVTSEGTRWAISIRDVADNSSQFGPPISENDLQQLINLLIDDRIIREDPDNQLFELRHDTIALTIHQWMSGLEQEIIVVRQTIENRYKEYLNRGNFLDAQDLIYIAPYRERLHLSFEMLRFLHQSEWYAAKKRHRWRVLGGTAVCLFVLIVSGLGLMSYFQAKEADKQRNEAYKQKSIAQVSAKKARQKAVEANDRLREARHNLGLMFNEKADSALKNRDYNSVRLYSLLTLENLDPRMAGSPRSQVVGNIISFPDYPIIFSSPSAVQHDGSINCLAFSPDGGTLASGSVDKTIRLWDVQTGIENSVMKGHTGGVNSVSFSPDGRTLASGSKDKTIRLWDVQTGIEKTVLKGHTGGVYSISFSPDGRTLTSSGDETIRLWDAQTGQEKAIPKCHMADRAPAVSFSPDGLTMAWAPEGFTLERNHYIQLWDVQTGQEKMMLKGAMHGISTVNFSPNSRTLASGSWGEIQLWDVQTGQEKMALEGVSSDVKSICFSPDGRTLASGLGDGSIQLWGVQTGQEKKVLLGHNGAVYNVSFSLDGRTITSRSGDNTIRLWDVQTGQEKAVLKRPKGAYSVRFSPDGRTIASMYRGLTGKDSAIRLWDVLTGKEKVVLEGLGMITSVEFSPDGRTIASGSPFSAGTDSTIQVWDVLTGKEKAVLKVLGNIISVCFSPDGRTIASGSSGLTGEANAIRLWDVMTGQAKTVLKGHTNGVSSVFFSPDGRTIAEWSGRGLEDKTIWLWDVQSGQEKAVLQGHPERVVSVGFSPDGRTIASGSWDRTIRLWDVKTGQTKAVLQGHTFLVTTVNFSPDGRTIASGSWDDTIRLWDVMTGQEKAVLKRYTESGIDVHFSPDGRTLASAGDNIIRMWDVPSGLEKAAMKGHTGRVISVGFSPDGRTLASAGDKTIRLWDVMTGREKGVLQGPDWVNSVIFSPDGRTLASAGDKTIRLLDVMTGQEMAVLKGHTSSVISIGFSPDGRTIASLSREGVRMWDLSFLYDSSPLAERIKQAEQRYNLKLNQLELQPIEPTRNLYKSNLRPPVWPKTHPFHWLPAAEKGDAAAMLQLGLIYDRDYELEKDYDRKKAFYWYEKAAKAGNLMGQTRIDNLNQRIRHQEATKAGSK
ncbi:MAG: hypothetical protein HQK60_06290 [Deltaproteobacteria bacterium]|nr:hypothetical protein [Deltaproteobacteria bacterium]